MANPSSQRLNSAALKKDFQLVTFEGLGKGWTRISTGWEPGSPFVWYWIGNIFSPALFLPLEIRSYGHIRTEPCKEDRAGTRPILSRSDWKFWCSIWGLAHMSEDCFWCHFSITKPWLRKCQEWERVYTEPLPALRLPCVILPISERYPGCGWGYFSSLSSWFHNVHQSQHSVL